MKRVIAFIIFLTFAYLVYQFGVNFIKTEHNVNYIKKIGDKEYSINEIYTKDKNVDYYYLVIRTSDKEFVFDIDNTFNKQQEIVENIYLYEKNNLTCMYPIFIGGKTTGALECNIDGKLYSLYSLQSEYDLSEFVNALPNYSKGQVFDKTIDEYYDLSVYKKNIIDKEFITLYNYKNIINVSGRNKSQSNFSDKDVYKNKDGILVDKYYIIPDYKNTGTHSSFKIINVVDNSYNDIQLKDNISSNYYNNGVVDDILYIFDRSNKVQYSINPKDNSYQVESTSGNKGKAYINGEWTEVTTFDLADKDIIFTEDYTKIKEDYDYISKNNKYYYYVIDGVFYKSYIKDATKSIKLFEEKNPQVIKIANDYIYYIQDTTLYRYKEDSIIPILERKEFKHNKENIYEVYWDVN